jgi:formylmethanofuran dehydrogenase subunit E
MRRVSRFSLVFVVLIQAVACGGAHHQAPPAESGHHAAPAHPAPSSSDDEGLRAVAAVHGGAGPWAVAGYRMGEFALRQLGLPRGSFELEVVHFTPESVQYSCIADGAAAATGASLGKLNLKLAEATPVETRTTYRNRASGQTLTLSLTDEFKGRFADVPREKLGEAGREVMKLRDEQIFRVVPSPAPGTVPDTGAPGSVLERK